MMKRIALCGIAVAALAFSAFADTVYLKDGTPIDGKVTKINDNCFALVSGSGEIVYTYEEIDRVEENDKTGTIDFAKANPKALQHEKMLEEATGLKADQREKVLAIVDRLASDDVTVYNQAVKEILSLQQQFDVYRFLKESRQGFGARLLPGALDVMLMMNKADAKEIAADRLFDQVSAIRAAVLELAAKHSGIASLDTIARGVVDADLEVRISAITTLGILGDKRATPVLISQLSDNNPRVRNASTTALTKIWSGTETVSFETPEQWTAHWQAAAKTVAKPIDVASLEPLFVLEPGTYVIAHE